MASILSSVTQLTQLRLNQLSVNSCSSDKLEDQKWFHGVLPKKEAEELLQEKGDFLVRESGNKSERVLSIYWGEDRHYRIEKYHGGWRIEDSVSFPTIPQLISYLHSSHQPLIKGKNIYLKTPVHRKKWQLRNDDIQMREQIGMGTFGTVYRGKYQGNDVAVKYCTGRISKEQSANLVQEGMILKEYDHPNIVHFIGIAAQKHPIMIVTEYVSGGALPRYLEKNHLSRKQLTRLARHAAKGMDYLERKGCIHRNLAASNCLVDEGLVLKISDFGMSRIEDEYYTNDKTLPFRWSAPETLSTGKYSSETDVWSFGILMWEIFTECKNVPYYYYHNDRYAVRSIQRGEIMEKPERAPTACYNIMKRCWKIKPEDRYDFSEIKEKLEEIYSSM
uniref:Tyrosine-protein kinase n=1 Tax=Crassostrea virginica TaxID=6565 RepID=A0A8B8C2Z9_CRAVI|nr:tyrosine-protein kinase Fer-like [Crassostrea virginica]